MKKLLQLVSPLLLAAGTALAGRGQPTGYLNASDLLVRESGMVTLDWNVEFPGTDKVDEIVDIDPEDDTIITRKDANVKVRVIGGGYAVGGDHAFLESYAKFSDEAWFNGLFTGYGDDIDPDVVLKERDVEEDVSLDFSFRGSVKTTRNSIWDNRAFNGWRTMGRNKGHGGILILKDGDVAPDFAPEHSLQTGVKTFLAPYLSADSTRIQIGSRDIIILVDLNKSSIEEGADYQDLVILMTVEEKRRRGRR